MDDLLSKIRKYFTNNEKAKELKKILDPLNKEIKEELRNTPDMEVNIDGIQAKISTQQRTSMNDLKLLAKLKKLKRKDLIKKIEVPDHEKIEKLIYDQELDAELLSDCLEVKIVEVLSVSKVRKKKEE